MSEIKITSYSSITQIPVTTFKDLECSPSFYFSKEFLESFETHHPLISHTYLLFNKNESPISIAVLQEFEINVEQTIQNMPSIYKIGKHIINTFSKEKIRLSLCGNIFISSAHGLFIKEANDAKKIYRLLANYITSNTKSDLSFFKDYNGTQNEIAQVVKSLNFHPFQVEPNMILPIQWKTFEEFKNDLKSKYRVKINKADVLSEHIEVKDISAKEIEEQSEVLQKLHNNVVSKSSYSSITFNIKTYIALKEHFGNNVIFKTYSKENTIVGFITAFKINDRLEAHFVGIDYSQNKTDAIYPRMLNDYVRLGITLGVKGINLGRTASEIKSTVGAVPESLYCYVKHKKTITNSILKPALNKIEITSFKQHTPFKKGIL